MSRPGASQAHGIAHDGIVCVLTGVLFLALVWPVSMAAEPPQRIVSAAPSITEMLYALGLGGRVVGVTTFCHYPPEVRRKPKIGSYLRPNFETILAMQPDLVVVLKEHQELWKKLEDFELPVLALQHNDLKGIHRSLAKLGDATGVPEAAKHKIAEIDGELSEIRGRAEGLPRRSVMFVVGRTPGTIQDLVVVGRGSFLNELIEIGGGRNAFGDAATYYPRIPREELYARRPEVIIDMGDMSETDGVTEAHKRSVEELWKQLPTLPAVQTGRVYAVAEDIFVVPGPRVVEAAEQFLRMIHPEVAH